MAKKQTKTKKRKIKAKNIIITFLLITILALFIIYIYSLKISSIIVKGNNLYSEWKIIKLAKLENYPSSMQNLSRIIEKKLEKDPYIKKAKVNKRFITNITIEIEENLPLFYYAPNKKTVLEDKQETDSNLSISLASF